VRFGGNPEVLLEPLAIEKPEYGLRVSDVDGEQHLREPR
jgi:hypothetical protein